MNPKMRPPNQYNFVDLPIREGERVVNLQAYRVETKKPRRWQFWQKEHIKYNVAVLTNYHRFFILDPDALTVEERIN